MTIERDDVGFGQDVDFGYIDRAISAPRQKHPQLVLNTANNSMLRSLRNELKRAASFTFSVAFVTPRAIALLKQELVDFEGVGRIVTSDYLGFNSPQAFAELLNLRRIGIDVRLHEDSAFHPKGYVFQRPEGVTVILGSSNLTENAIVRNHEWNLRVSAARDSDLAEQFSNLLDDELFRSVPLTQEWIDAYASSWAPLVRASRPISPTLPLRTESEITPNGMQIEALNAIAESRAMGNDKALIISATGTGKTILSALDVRAMNPKRLLFVAHREQILDKALREFQRVLGGPDADFGKLAGSTRQTDRRYLFATVQTLSQRHVLDSLDPAAFDYILIDEVHRAGASSFEQILEYFRPEFLLGMTATPERPDGINIFEIFNHNVPYEIRLKSALELNMLAPFHYYGVADVTFDDGFTTSEITSLERLVGAKRVEHVVNALKTYGQAGVAPRGLIFCSRKDEAHALSRELNERTLHGAPLRTVALTGEDSIANRERVVELLEAGELDYVLTVDIFNEGVDIPTINQVVMLRQTQSSIVFVQQLGRGLRNAVGKEYLVVIDFIGNYTNNFLIPIALFGDDSLNRESLRKNLVAAEEVGVIAGLSSVRFDPIAQERVLRSLATTKLDSLHNLKAAIDIVRHRIGQMPLLMDFLRFESVDPILLATKVGNYRELLAKLYKDDSGLTLTESRILSMISRELLTAKRPHELLLLRELLRHGDLSSEAIATALAGVAVPAVATADSAMRSITLEFNTATERQNFKAGGAAEAIESGGLRLSTDIARSYQQSAAFRRDIDDVIATGLALIASRYRPERPFTPGLQYSRKDACRLLNWSSNMYSTLYGYKVDSTTGTCPIFVTLDKSHEVSAGTAYEDVLVDPHTMLWFTKSKRTLDSPDVRPIVANEVDLHVFAKKDDAEGADFYYLGLAQSADAKQTTMPGAHGRPLSVVTMNLHFYEPINAGLYDYFHRTVTV